MAIEDLLLYIIVFLPVIVLIGASLAVRRFYGQNLTLAFALITTSAIAVNMIVAFRVSMKYAAIGGWTAATLTPFVYWIVGCLIIVVFVILWLSGMGIFFYLKRRVQTTNKNSS